MVQLPIIAVFETPYIFEDSVGGTISNIGDETDAARHIAKLGIDNGLGNHVQNQLKNSDVFKGWRKAMPSRTPSEIAKYQKNYRACDLATVSNQISQIACTLSPGQRLFHGGLWWGNGSINLQRPLSTSFCPQVALRNAEWRAKAFYAGRIDLIIIRTSNANTPVFVFKQSGTNLGHENEVLLAAGATLTKVSETLVRSDYVASDGTRSKSIPFYVVEVEVS